MFARWYGDKLRRALARPYVQIVFGARQTGKSTLLRGLLPPDALIFDLANAAERSQMLAHPSHFLNVCRQVPKRAEPTTVFVDEAQLAPAVFDNVQHLYDGDKRRWRFVLCGSSARKLRKTGANLLPGRCFLHRLMPLTLAERPTPQPAHAAYSTFPLALSALPANATPFPSADLETRLACGELPGVVAAEPADRAELLRAYAVVHLEEEIRREALVKDWGAFLRFLAFAAAESGGILNYAAISQESGLALNTVKSHYQLLTDMFIGFSVPAWSRSRRKNLLSTPKFLFFDLGVRNAAAGQDPSPATVRANPGPLFEQWVGVELWKRLQYLGGSLHYLRTRDGAEVDYIVEHAGRLLPVEVKWTENPSPTDARHLLTFLAENPKRAKHAYIICRCERPLRLHDKVTALPWYCL
jgi:predicted AAA+ superfamily ATPase